MKRIDELNEEMKGLEDKS